MPVGIVTDIDFLLENPWHDAEGRFADPDELDAGSFSKDDETTRARRRTGKKPRKAPVMGACGREAREKGGDVRCHDGRIKDFVGSK